MLIQIVLTTLLATLAPASLLQASDRVVVPEGPERTVTVDDFAPRTPSTRTHNEAWTYLLLLDDGMQATFTISRANLGRLMGSVAGAEFSISGFDGQTYRMPREYPAENLTFDRARTRLEVHPDVFVEGSLGGTHRIRFHTTKDDQRYEVDLSLTDIARGLTWGDGVFHLGSERMGLFIHIPRARVSGRVAINGTARDVTGTAYMDHTFQSDFVTKMIDGAYRYVKHGDNPEVGLFVMPAPGYEDRVVGFGGAMRDGRFRLNLPREVEVISTRTSLGVDVPRQMVFRFEGGHQTILNRGRDSHAYSSLETLSSIQRSVVRRFIGGEAFAFRGYGSTNLRERVAYDFVIVR